MEELRFVTLSVLLALVWGGTVLAWLLRLAKDRARRVSTLLMLGFALAFGPIAFSKNGGDPPLRSGALASAPIVSLLLAEVWTNAVFDLSMPSNAVVHGPWLRRGASDDWFWLHATNALFRAGTNAFRSVRVSSRGTLSFPDGSRLEPFHAVLGVLPEPNWTNAPSRVWHAPAAGGGRLFTWENAALDRDPATSVSFQAELRRDGGVIGRYDLPHPATNFAIAAFGETALSVHGGITNAATVRRANGTTIPETSLAELLRDATRFELVWRAAEGDPDVDPDGDGLTTRDEIGRHGTDPKQADTDGDGLSDASEILLGSNPLDADEDGNGVPDGIDPATWETNALWAANGTNGANVTISLVAPIPSNATATLLVGDLAIPLREPASWPLHLEPGVIHSYRLFVSDGATARLVLAASQPRMRGTTHVIPGESFGDPIWEDGTGGVFDGPSPGGGGELAVPELELRWDGPDGESNGDESARCLRGADSADFELVVRPERLRPFVRLDGFEETADGLLLRAPAGSGSAFGTAELSPPVLRRGLVSVSASVHRCDATSDDPYCSECGDYDPVDAELSVSSRLLTLKHDPETDVSIVHPNSPGETLPAPRIEIRKEGTDAWATLSAGATLSPWHARIAGRFELRGVTGGRATEPVSVEVQFPSVEQIAADPVVVLAADAAWTATTNACTRIPNRRREFGFAIRLNTTNDTYVCDELCEGPSVPPWETGEVHVPIDPYNDPEEPQPNDTGAVYLVANFHTHTSPVYAPAYLEVKPVGPSTTDCQTAVAQGVPGIVLDYIPTDLDENTIPAGHPLESPTRFYFATPPGKRIRQ